MATYNDKLHDSLKTKLKLFLFRKAFEKNIEDITEYIKKVDRKEILEEFKNFKLNLKISHAYSAQYYQFEESKIIENLNSLQVNLYEAFMEDYKATFMKNEDFNKLVNIEKCSYCGITKREIEILGEAGQLNNKRSETRGYTLEIDRKEPNLEYTKENCCMSCYWCNNAKTDEFIPSEFKEIAKGIHATWKVRGKLVNSFNIIEFEEIEFWKDLEE